MPRQIVWTALFSWKIAIWLIKKFRQTHQKFAEKFIGDNLSITYIALRNWDLSISIGIALSFFEIID